MAARTPTAILIAMPAPSTAAPPETARRQDLRLPPVIFGTSALGNLHRATDPATKAAVVAACVAHAPRELVFDSAGKYGAGMALTVLGDALRAQGIAPEAVRISNKLGWRRMPLRTAEPTFEPGAWVGLTHDATLDLSEEGILRCYEEGLALLGAPYRTELVSVHDPDEYLAQASSPAEQARRWDDLLGAYRALARLRSAGVVQGIGVGTKDWRLAQRLQAAVALDWVMLACSCTILTHPPAVRGFIASLAAQGIPVVLAAVWHGGFLAGGDTFDYRPLDPMRDRARLDWRAGFAAVCHRHGVRPAQAAVRFAARVPGVASVALGPALPAQVPELVTWATTPLPAALWRALRDQALIHADVAEAG